MMGTTSTDARASRRLWAAIAAGIVFGVWSALLIVLVPLSIRNSAPFGSVQTVDFDRNIAILGGEVRPNYPGFDRVKLDLRAYSVSVPGDKYDFMLTIESVDDQQVVRHVPFSVPAADIPAAKSTFTDIGTSVDFEPISESAGRTYFLSLERGPRNVDDVVTLWGIRSYSTLTAADVLEAAVNGYDVGLSARANRSIVQLLIWLALVLSSAVVSCTVAAAWPFLEPRLLRSLGTRIT